MFIYAYKSIAYARDGQLIWLMGHFKKAALTGGPYLLVEIEASFGEVSHSNKQWDLFWEAEGNLKSEHISWILSRATENAVAGRIWPAGRYLPTPGLC